MHFDDFSINYAGDEIGLYPFSVARRTPAVYSPSKITHRSGHVKMHDVFGIGVVVQRERGVYYSRLAHRTCKKVSCISTATRWSSLPIGDVF